ncbi:MAG: NHLP bacteriocin export ABC transporter permease/ATPase subunit [Phycisphaeraceae bacterium]|nr:NHLP bacteriocin export ABC transporter permease/ATPase subunit [Phycisphaeraceae bacterium]
MSDHVATIFSERGTIVPAGSNQPLPLIDPGGVLLVRRGHVDVFAITIVHEDGARDLRRTHLLRVPAGQILLGFRMPQEGTNALLLGFGSADAEVARLDAEAVEDASGAAEFMAAFSPLVDRWISAICTLCADDHPPAGAINLREGATVDLEAGRSVQPQTGVLWLRIRGGTARFLGEADDPGIDGSRLFPLGKDAWITAETPLRVRGFRASEVAGTRGWWRGIERFQDAADAIIDRQRVREREESRRRLVAKARAGRSAVHAALSELGAVLSRRVVPNVGRAGDTTLLNACRLVGAAQGIEIRDPGRGDDGIGSDPIARIARASRFAYRRVMLRRGWHRRDGGPLLGFVAADGRPVAILPAGPRRYEVHDPLDGEVVAVDRGVAEEIAVRAFAFTRCLPDRPLSAIDLIRFASRGIGRDVATVAAVGGVGALLTLATPVAIGHLFDAVIPWAERVQLLQVTIGLVVAALAAGAFQVTRNIALIRIQHRAAASLQAALWERVINLPARFFSRYSAGDMATRAMGVDAIRDELSTSAVTAIVTGAFSIVSVVVLFVHSPAAAVVALLLVMLVLAVIMTAGVLQMHHQRELEECEGRMSGMLLQFMNGIAKIRVAAAEHRAFAEWARRFSHQARVMVRARTLNNHLAVFNAVFPVLGMVVVFWLLADAAAAPGMDRATGLSTGSVLAFLSAFTILLFGMIQLGVTAANMLTVVPLYRRLRPILETAPEIDPARIDPGPLRGRIEVSNVSFRYEKDGPAILDAVSLHVEPGEFIAVVGPSGSGKSTLLRILLGFEAPESGTVSYDGFDLAGLDPRAVRRQLGVVLQGGDLAPGDIFTNIVGSAVDLTVEDAWEAARQAGMAGDIAAMPMGMHTILSEGGGSLSGGQHQRLLIARALVSRPRIVFFDEATSALDNPTQAVVTGSLDRLRATRIVIAHRLSTIVGADRIYVMERGRVVQCGTYRELAGVPGLFHELIKRQIA